MRATINAMRKNIFSPRFAREAVLCFAWVLAVVAVSWAAPPYVALYDDSPPADADSEAETTSLSFSEQLAELIDQEKIVVDLNFAPPAEALAEDLGQALLAKAKERGHDYVVRVWADSETDPKVRAELMDVLAGESLGEMEGDLSNLAASASEKILEREAWWNERPEDNPQRIVVKWGIESAVDNFGYIAHRQDSEDAEYKPVSRRILPGVGTTSSPHVFRYIDTEVEPGNIYRYKVEEVDLKGAKTFFVDPRSNEIMVLAGKSKPMSRREMATYGDKLFHTTKIDR
jgi:hypothetical protein